jgi:hypothetical protein
MRRVHTRLNAVFTVLSICLLLAASPLGCSKAAPRPASASTPAAPGLEPNAVPPEEAAARNVELTADLSGETEAIRQVIMAYWEAFNAYDVERVLSYMEGSWRKERSETVRGDIGRMKLFRVKLGVEEESPPVITGNGEAEVMIKLSTPIGVKHDYFRLVKVGEEWKVSFSEER